MEDDVANMQYLKELLGDTGLNIHAAYTGSDSLKVMKEKNVDIILMDVRLPDISGIKLTRMIKKDFPHVVVIAQTAYASQDDVRECLEAGCSGYISKPIDGSGLLNLIHKHLQS